MMDTNELEKELRRLREAARVEANSGADDDNEPHAKFVRFAANHALTIIDALKDIDALQSQLAEKELEIRTLRNLAVSTNEQLAAAREEIAKLKDGQAAK